MNRTRGLVGLVCIALMVCWSSAWAMVIAPAPLPQRVATADCIVVGKVTGFADRTEAAPRFPGDKEKAEYQVALVRVETTIQGAKDIKEIRVGFIPPMVAPPGGPVRPHLRRPSSPALVLDQEAMLFLVKHHEADFYTIPMYFHVINKESNADFDTKVKEVKHCAKLLADPKAGIEAKDMSDRFLTAGMLLARYRQRRLNAGEPKNEPIDPQLSKKILLTLAEADWNPRPGRPGEFQMRPQVLFSQLDLTEKDGWKQPKDLKQFPEAAKKWCKDNADTFVLTRFVYEKEHKK